MENEEKVMKGKDKEKVENSEFEILVQAFRDQIESLEENSDFISEKFRILGSIESSKPEKPLPKKEDVKGEQANTGIMSEFINLLDKFDQCNETVRDIKRDIMRLVG